MAIRIGIYSQRWESFIIIYWI